jgi:hypothetical protein
MQGNQEPTAASPQTGMMSCDGKVLPCNILLAHIVCWRVLVPDGKEIMQASWLHLLSESGERLDDAVLKSCFPDSMVILFLQCSSDFSEPNE